MRQKMLEAHRHTANMMDIKQDKGGIIDVEFMVQYLVLLYAHEYPQLSDNIGNIALLRQLAELGVISGDLAEAVAQSYLALRKQQHAMKLQGLSKLELPANQMTTVVAPVNALWQKLMLDE